MKKCLHWILSLFHCLQQDLGDLVDSLEPPKDIQASMEAVRALKRELQVCINLAAFFQS